MISPNGINYILFDLDGTLRHSRPSFNQDFCDFAVEAGLVDNPECRLQALRWLHYYWAQSPELLVDLESFGDLNERFWTNHTRLHLLAFGSTSQKATTLAPELQRRMAEEHKPEDWVPPDVPETLRRLKCSGLQLAVVSNRARPYEDQLQLLELSSYFEFALASGEVNAWKPEPEIFLLALRRLGAAADETLYVGDNYFADVIGAQRAGIRPVLLDPLRIFPEASCAIIDEMADLLILLGNSPKEI